MVGEYWIRTLIVLDLENEQNSTQMLAKKLCFETIYDCHSATTLTEDREVEDKSTERNATVTQAGVTEIMHFSIH